MAGEISLTFRTGASVYSQVYSRTSGSYIWNGAAFEVYSQLSGHLATYPVSLTELGAGGRYQGNMPAAIPPGTYDVVARQQLQVPYLENDPVVAAGQVEWNGTLAAPISDAATSGLVGTYLPSKLTRGIMYKNYPIYLRSSTDHVSPLTSGIVSGQISRDGGAFGALQSGAFNEIGLGFFSLQALTSGDLLANSVALLFTANQVSGGSSDPLPISYILQRSSGQ